ncbi:hypothetical protein COU57_02990 [Candidatus Pacearchaeota archaeon CG10_big_fil_rev_8_21_14_0_10_32_14]|nr:MAG: hypothetical protein COU57_02990 [Candidatus Pacearchaeota archaeon CG10_big_fil_rev_8_21_14_0_10_32_14]
MLFLKNKWGLSEVVGTFLIILLVVVLGVLIFGASKVFLDKATKIDKCSSTNLDKVKFNPSSTCFHTIKYNQPRKWDRKCNPEVNSCPNYPPDVNVCGDMDKKDRNGNDRTDFGSNINYDLDDDNECEITCYTDADCSPKNPVDGDMECSPLELDGTYDCSIYRRTNYYCVNGNTIDSYCYKDVGYILMTVDVKDVALDGIVIEMEGGGNSVRFEIEDGRYPCTYGNINPALNGCGEVLLNYAKCWDTQNGWWNEFLGDHRAIPLKENEGHTYNTGRSFLPVKDVKPEVIKLIPVIGGKECMPSEVLNEVPECIPEEFPFWGELKIDDVSDGDKCETKLGVDYDNYNINRDVGNCGNRICEVDESSSTCPYDCACGDGIYDIINENEGTCPKDVAYCGDGICSQGKLPSGDQEFGIGINNCHEDCDGATCDLDGSVSTLNCESGELSGKCVTDCGWCGDGYCAGTIHGEDTTTCLKASGGDCPGPTLP